MPTALITGIAGQDGGYLAERLVAEGCEVHGLVHDGDRNLEALRARCPSVTLHRGDLTDEVSLAAAVAAADPDEVYNFAGISSVADAQPDSKCSGENGSRAVLPRSRGSTISGTWR